MNACRDTSFTVLSVCAFFLGTTAQGLWSADCNQNGTEDALDISSGTSKDCNSNGIPDECELAATTFAGFKASRSYVAGMTPFSVAIGDWDGDGDLDLDIAVVNRDSANVSVLLNDGDGTFAGKRDTYAVGAFPTRSRPPIGTATATLTSRPRARSPATFPSSKTTGQAHSPIWQRPGRGGTRRSPPRGTWTEIRTSTSWRGTTQAPPSSSR